MKPIFEFIVEPLDGKRYDNERSGLITSVSIEDHKSTQRHAKVIETYLGYIGPIEPGDTIIVHHNVFREFYDIHGKRKPGNNHFKDNLFLVDEYNMYMYRKPGGDWQAVDPYIFVSPVKSDDRMFDTSVLKQLFGRVEYSSTELIPKGSLVSFQPECEYEFWIEDNLMYRMYERNITLIE
jgi:hypothetical protein